MNTTKESVDYFNENRNFSKFILKRYFYESMYDDDMNQIADLGLWKACTTFNDSKGIKFTAYATRVICNEVLQEIRRRKKIIQTVSLDEPISDEFSNISLGDCISDNYDFISEIAIKCNVHNTFCGLTHKQRKIFTLWLVGLGQKEIAEKLGYSRAYINKVINQCKKKVKDQAS